jgi:hypothetical protein
MTGPPIRPAILLVLQRMDELDLTVQSRDDDRPVDQYPSMPTGTCYVSSRILAEVFPELSVVYGKVTFFVHGIGCEVDHAWNVRPDGQIVDSTLRLPGSAEDVRYWPGEEPS